jgi:hypothetical protein
LIVHQQASTYITEEIASSTDHLPDVVDEGVTVRSGKQGLGCAHVVSKCNAAVGKVVDEKNLLLMILMMISRSGISIRDRVLFVEESKLII